jgi:hypothetical protein
MKEETKPILAETDQVLMYGDRVKFQNMEGDLEGLYAGPYLKNPKLAVVTVVTQGSYRGRVLYPYITDLKRVDHPDPVFVNAETKKPEPENSDKGNKFDIESLKEMRDNIMDEFDFVKVHAVMEALEWGWATGNGFDTVVPEVSDIRKEARNLMNDVIDRYIETGNDWCGVSTGGLDVELVVNKDDGLPDLTLKFVVEDWTEGGEFWDEYEKSFERRKLMK